MNQCRRLAVVRTRVWANQDVIPIHKHKNQSAILLRWQSTSTNTSHFAKSKMDAEQLRELHDRIIRVDHAGEYGADRIYAGQMAILGMNCTVMGI